MAEIYWKIKKENWTYDNIPRNLITLWRILYKHFLDKKAPDSDFRSSWSQVWFPQVMYHIVRHDTHFNNQTRLLSNPLWKKEVKEQCVESWIPSWERLHNVCMGGVERDIWRSIFFSNGIIYLLSFTQGYSSTKDGDNNLY